MRLNFRHGIISTQAGNFLQFNGNGNVNLLANTRAFRATIADRDSNYLHTENNTVVDAWTGPFVSGEDYFLYMDFDLLTFDRTFGFTQLVPIAQNTAPVNPQLGQIWFDTSTNTQFVWIGSTFARTYRLVVARLNTMVFSSVSMDAPLFTGTQIGNNSSVSAGSILFTEFGKVVKQDDGTFFTTEDQFFTNQSQVVGVRLEASVTLARCASPALAQFQIAALGPDASMTSAQYPQTENSVLVVVGEDLVFGEVGNTIVQGTVTNPDWDFSAFVSGTRLWVDNGELVVVDPYTTNQANFPVPQVPVAKIISRDTIIFQQGLGGVGPRGPQGSLENLPVATTTELGAVLLSTPPVSGSIPIVIGNNDTRLMNAPFASQTHMHIGTDISITPAGNIQGSNVQLAIEELDAEKVNVAGGSITGNFDIAGQTTLNDSLSITNGGLTVNGDSVFNNTVSLQGDPVAPLEAVTKRYVDNLTSGLQWLDPVCLANLIGDDVIDPTLLTPNNGDSYILPAAGLGAWTGFVQNDVVRWNASTLSWVNGGQLTTEFIELRFIIAGTSSSVPTGNFAGREREIVVYTDTGTIAEYIVPTDTNAVYVCNVFDAAAFNQYVFNETTDIWTQTGGSQSGIAPDETTITLSAATLSTINFADGGTVDAATYRGADAATLFADITHDHDTQYSQLGHTHNAVDVVVTGPVTSTIFGALAVPTDAQLVGTTAGAVFAELLAKKATNQPTYATEANLPAPASSRGMNAHVLDDGSIRFAIGNAWVPVALNDGSVQNHEHRINYDLTFFAAGPVAVNTGGILARTIVPRSVSLPPNSPVFARVINPPTTSVDFQIAINDVITSIIVTLTPTMNGGMFTNIDTGPDTFELVAGDYIDLISPATSDTAVTDLALTIVGIADTGTP